MTAPLPISCFIIAKDEAKRVARAISSVIKWVDEVVVVVDASSSDGTQDVARRLGARVAEEAWLGYGAQNITAFHQITHPHRRREVPAAGRVQSLGTRAGLDGVSGVRCQPTKRPPDAVQNRAQESRPELDGKPTPHRLDRLAQLEPRGFLVHLQCRGVTPYSNHFSQEVPVADPRKLVECHAGHGPGLRQRSRKTHQHSPAHPSLTR